MERRCAVVTGATGGIGSAIAIELAKAGHDIIIHYRSNETQAAELKAKVEGLNVRAEAMKADLSKYDEAKALIDNAMSVFGRVDVLVNNAGITRDGLMMRMSEEAFDDVVDLNLKGAFFCTKEASLHMMRARYGRIINIASVAGLVANPGQVNYSAAKAGLIGMTRSAARELGSRGITVNAICPGVIDTDMSKAIPESAKDALLQRVAMKRIGLPEDVSRLVSFIASEEASYITGQAIVVDGGLSI